MGLFDRNTEALFLIQQKARELQFAEKERQTQEIQSITEQAKLRMTQVDSEKERRDEDAEKVRSGLTKEELQELINAKSKSKSTMPAQSQKPSSGSTSSKP